MENETELLSKEEKGQNIREKISFWRKAIFPDEYAIVQFFSMSVLDPAIVIYLYLYVTGRVLNIPLTYLCGVLLVMLWFVHEGIARRKLWEEMAEDRTEIIQQKLEELKEMEKKGLLWTQKSRNKKNLK